MIRSVLMLILLANSCQAQYFQLAFDDGRVDSFDSSLELFNREMCDVKDQWASVKLTSNVIQSLLPLIEAADFFELPVDQIESKVVDKDKGISLTCSPCAISHLQIKLGQNSNKVFWDCGCASKKAVPDIIKPLVERIKSIIYEKKAVKSMADTDCFFI